MMRYNFLRVVGWIGIVICLCHFEEVSSRVPPKRLSTTTTTSSPGDGDVCYGVSCQGLRICDVNELVRPTCICSAYCSPYYYPVCGSNNKTYENDCILRREACTTNTNITTLFWSRCPETVVPVCDDFTCPNDTKCAVDEKGLPTCVCNTVCSWNYDPVCGSDRVTYGNDCEIQRQACVTNSNLTIAYRGQCHEESVCDGVRCPAGKICAVNENHSPSCICNKTCPYTLTPVCGSDGTIYGNECDLRRQACLTGSNLTVAYDGLCYNDTVCEGVTCQANRVCLVNDNNRPMCVCTPYYDYNYDPVCGSDEKTYTNERYLQRDSCFSRSNVTLAYRGGCYADSLCNGVRCPYPKQCKVNEDNSTSCVCNEVCDKYYNPVCGSNKKTYYNYCLLDVEACKSNTSLYVQYYGVCNKGLACEGIYCPYGKHCEADENNRTTCVCNSNCSTVYYNPICGSDNKTYANSCELQSRACVTNSTITVQYSGRCEDGPGCKNYFCPLYTSCAVDEQNRPSCVCNTNCYMYYSPICGSDNKTYSNDCLLRMNACMTQRNTTLALWTKCEADPCNSRNCPIGSTCSLDESNRTVCICDENCYQDLSPVCGSDSITYINDCELRKQSCLSGKNLTVAYYQRCESSICKGINCSVGRECAVDESKSPSCVCIDNCNSYDYNYGICGSDNKTYDNVCDLQKTACLTNTKTTLASYGICNERSSCDGKSCSSGRYCALDEQNRPTCVCTQDCGQYFYPICGTDEKTYNNICELQKKACMTGRNVTMAYPGHCNEGSVCDGIICPDGRRCAVDEEKLPTCVCNESCSYLDAPVCGRDSVTYASMCELQRQACVTNTNITVFHGGECVKETACNGVNCGIGRYCAIAVDRTLCVCNQTCPTDFTPICGSDGTTYGNLCELQRESCLSDTNITVAYKGLCYEGTACYGVTCPIGNICTVDAENTPQCVCNQYCSYNYDPVCGTDGTTYSSECYLQQQSCLSKSNVTLAYKGSCYKESLCQANNCVYPMQCKVDENNRTSCLCNDDCSRFYYYPLCGSNNKTYDNYCQLQAAACKTNTSIYVAYYGSCELRCRGVYCSYDKHCEVTANNQTTCVCNTVCPTEYSPICGSDNATYSNLCELQKNACLTNTSVTQQYPGRCEDGPGCYGYSCQNDRSCRVDEQNRPSCVCSPYCDFYYSPVCGSDNKTYNYNCLLELTACMSNQSITIASWSRCKNDPCYGIDCSIGRTCAVGEKGRPVCVCNTDCYSYYSPVCGTNGVTYINSCQFQKEVCLTDSIITLAYYRRCTGLLCQGVTCPAGLECAVDEEYQPVCVCTQTCNYEYSPVCGSDGNTYLNNCELGKEACMTNTTITVAYSGICSQGYSTTTPVYRTTTTPVKCPGNKKECRSPTLPEPCPGNKKECRSSTLPTLPPTTKLPIAGH